MEASRTLETGTGSRSPIQSFASSLKTHLGGKGKATIRDLESAINSLESRNALLKDELDALRAQKELDERDHRDDLERKGRSVATDSGKFWPKVDKMRDELVTLTAQEWLKRSRAEDPQLDEKCETEPGFREGILGYMECDNDLGIRRRASSWIEDKMPWEWASLYDRLSPNTDRNAELSWKASINPCTTPNRVYPTLDITLDDKRLTASGYFIEIPPIYLKKYKKVQASVSMDTLRRENHRLMRERNTADWERHKIENSSNNLANMSVMLHSQLGRTKVELSQKIFREYLKEEKTAGRRHSCVNSWNEFDMSERLSHAPTFDNIVARHAENILKNGWWDTWISFLPKEWDDKPNGKDPYELCSELGEDVEIERQLRGQERGTFVRSLGKYKDGEHALQDWIPDSSFLSGLGRKIE